MDFLYKVYQACTFKLNNIELKKKIDFKPRACIIPPNKLFNLKESNDRFKEFQKMNRKFDLFKKYQQSGILSIILTNQSNAFVQPFPIFNQKNILTELNKKNIILEQTNDDPGFTLLGLIVIGAGIFGLFFSSNLILSKLKL
jgi:hypothetical protein